MGQNKHIQYKDGGLIWSCDKLGVSHAYILIHIVTFGVREGWNSDKIGYQKVLHFPIHRPLDRQEAPR